MDESTRPTSLSATEQERLIRLARQAMARVYSRYQRDPDVDIVLGIARVGMQSLAEGRGFEGRAPVRDPVGLLERSRSRATGDDEAEGTRGP